MNINNELERLKYRPRTIETYIQCYQQFLEYIKKKTIEEISQEDVDSYIDFLLHRKKSATSTIRQSISALDVILNKVYSKDLDIQKLQIPQDKKEIPVILSEKEVIDIIENVKETKARLIISIMYSAGLELSEAIQLKRKDINFENNRITFSSIQGNRKSTILSEYVKNKLLLYIEENQPGTYLFEGINGRHTIHQMQFKKTLGRQFINLVLQNRSQ